MKLNARRFALLVVALLLAAVLVWAFLPKPVEVDLATVERGDLRVTVDHEGRTRVREPFVVSAPVAGRVLRIELEPGDPVEARETVLATFEPSDPSLLDARSRAEAEARVKAARAALGQVQAELQRAEAQRTYARAELERVRRLAADEIIPRDRLDATEANARSAEEAARAARFAVANAEHELEVARSSLVELPGEDRVLPGGGSRRAPIVLRSPVDGVVLRRLRESEAVVRAGDPLLEVADPADLEMVVDYLSTDAVQIDPGDRALIDQWGGGETLEGRVRRIEPAGFTKISALGVEEQRVNVIVDFADPRQAWKALGDAYRVEVRVVVWEGEGLLRVPESALFRHGREQQGWAVFRVEDGRAREVPVELGHRNGLVAEVLSGLAEGDRVVIHPGDAVQPGVRVTERAR